MFSVHSPRCNVSDNKLGTQCFGHKGLHQILSPFTCIAADEGLCGQSVRFRVYCLVALLYSAFLFKSHLMSTFDFLQV